MLESPAKPMIAKKDLLVIAQADKACSTRSIPAILSHSLVELKSGSLSVTGCDGDMWVKRWAPCEGEEFKACVKDFSERIKALPDGDIEIECTDRALVITCGKIRQELPSIYGDDFPAIPEPKTELTHFNGEQFSRALSRVKKACSLDFGKPVLSGVHVTEHESKALILGQDSFRSELLLLSEDWTALQGQTIPPKLISFVGADDFEVAVENGRVFLLFADALVVGQLQQGAYPISPKMFTSEWPVSTSVSTDCLLAALTRAKAYTEVSGKIRLSLTPSELAISVENPSVGNFRETLSVSGKDSHETACNVRFLIDALVDSNAGSVILSFGEWPLPIKVEAENDASYMAFIQPLHAIGAA